MTELTPIQQRVQHIYNEVFRPYQRMVFEHCVKFGSWYNCLDMGMGKSLVTSTSIMYLEAWPCMVVCPKSAMYVWEEELRNWFGEGSVIYVGKPKQREEAWKQFVNGGFKFIITNYRLAKELSERLGISSGGRGKSRGSSAKATTPLVRGVIADEIHGAGLLNHKTDTYKLFQVFAKHIKHRFLLTGTPIRKGCIDLYGPLSIVVPQVHDSYWKFVAKWCEVINDGFGKEIQRNPRDIPRFRAMLRNFADMLKKKDYLHELPGKTRQAIPVELDDEQERIYRELAEEMMSVTDSGELIISPGVLGLTVRLRQLLICPQELGLTTRGVAINTMLEMAGDLVEDRKPFVIFTPFKRAVSWVEKALREEFPGITVFSITGGLTAEEFAAQWQGFQHFSGTSPSVLICVIRSGASFHATRASTSFFVGYEWDFNQNEQAEDRLNRIGQTEPVMCYYFKHKGTIDEDIIQRLNDKTFVSNLILSDEKAFRLMWERMNGDVKNYKRRNVQ